MKNKFMSAQKSAEFATCGRCDYSCRRHSGGFKLFRYNSPQVFLHNNGVILSALGIVFFVNALIQGNSVSMWLAFCFIVPAVMSFLCKYGITSYGEIYPVYIALPGIACLGAMIISREFWRLTKAALVFFIAAAIFVPHAAGALGMGWTLAMLAGYLVILAAALIVYLNKGEKK